MHARSALNDDLMPINKCKRSLQIINVSALRRPEVTQRSRSADGDAVEAGTEAEAATGDAFRA